ncbi:MAG: PAS domain-containing sensor histidine kinase [Chloroflexota bacterium]
MGGLRALASYVVLVLAFLAGPFFENSLLPGYYSAIMHLVPVAFAAFAFSTRGVVLTVGLSLVITLYYAYGSPIPIEVKIGRLLAFAAIVYLAIRLSQERERAVKHAGEEMARQMERQERARLEAVLQQMPSGVVIAQAPSGAVTLTNATIRSMWPRVAEPPTSIEGYGLYESHHADGRIYRPDEWPLARAIATGEVVVDEEVHLDRGADAPGTLSASAAPIRNEQGQIVAAVAVFSDVSERRRAESEQERLLAELETTFDAAAAGVIAFDREARTSRLNAAAARILGLSQDDLGLPMESLFSRLRCESVDGLAMPFELFPAARALRGEKVASVEMAIHRQGQKIWVFDGAGPIRARDGRILGSVVSFVDVSEMRHLHEEQRRLLDALEVRAAELVHERDQLHILVESIVDAVFVCDGTGTITLANQAGLALIGREGTSVAVALSDYLVALQLHHPDGRVVLREELAVNRALLGETVSAHQEVGTRPETRRRIDLLISAAPLKDGQGRVVGAVAVARDISELRELDRLKDEFLAVAAHELKTPVTITKGYAQALLRSGHSLPESHRKMLQSIDRGADRIDGLVGDLLDIVRLQTAGIELRSERVDLAELVEEVSDRLAATAPKHRLRLAAVEPVVVQGDRARLEQVLENLLDNALRYSPGGGDVSIGACVRAGAAVVSVEDQGVGIPEERQSRIGQRFYRAHTGTAYDYGGMGVGLFISKEVVERHGGKLWFESTEGHGSTFHFSLPLRTELGGDG